MSRRKIPYGGVLKCDMPGCGETFTTYSVVTLARKQAVDAGWARVKGRTIQDGEGHSLESGARKIDLCPTHKPRPIMEGAKAS